LFKISVPNHAGLDTYMLRLLVLMGLPLVIWSN